jgi:hypothetical protein
MKSTRGFHWLKSQKQFPAGLSFYGGDENSRNLDADLLALGEARFQMP